MHGLDSLILWHQIPQFGNVFEMTEGGLNSSVMMEVQFWVNKGTTSCSQHWTGHDDEVEFLPCFMFQNEGINSWGFTYMQQDITGSGNCLITGNRFHKPHQIFSSHKIT